MNGIRKKRGLINGLVTMSRTSPHIYISDRSWVRGSEDWEDLRCFGQDDGTWKEQRKEDSSDQRSTLLKISLLGIKWYPDRILLAWPALKAYITSGEITHYLMSWWHSVCFTTHWGIFANVLEIFLSHKLLVNTDKHLQETAKTQSSSSYLHSFKI